MSSTNCRIYINRERRGGWRKNARVCANLCHKPSRNLFCVANNLVAQNDRIPCRQKKIHSMWVLLRGGVFETSVLQAIRNDSRTDPDFTQVNRSIWDQAPIINNLCHKALANDDRLLFWINRVTRSCNMLCCCCNMLSC